MACETTTHSAISVPQARGTGLGESIESIWEDLLNNMTTSQFGIAALLFVSALDRDHRGMSV
eukprot:scaffold310840_cov16-Prasinocladus_malaysianus.AAC.1